MGEDIMGSADYLRAELHNAAEHDQLHLVGVEQDGPSDAASRTSGS